MRGLQGRLLGKAEVLGAGDLLFIQRDVWAAQAVASAAIDGQGLDLAAVRASVARRLGLAPEAAATVPADVEGLLDVMQDAAVNWNSELTQERLCRWQAALFPGGRSQLRRVETGRYRTRLEPMQVASGPAGTQALRYEAPPASAVPAQMRCFLDWFNGNRQCTSVDGILRAGLAHLWFESIHPFEDGNGAVGRAIADLAIAQDARQPLRLQGLSVALQRRQHAYYVALNRAQRGSGDVTAPLAWFTEVFVESCRYSARLADEALAGARFWHQHREVELNGRQRKVLNRMLERGPGKCAGDMTPRTYVALTGVRSVTASRDLADLVAKALLARHGAGRSTSYNLVIPGRGAVPERGGPGPRAAGAP